MSSAAAGLYLCHRVSPSTLAGTGTLLSYDGMKPRAHTGTAPCSQHQTGPLHTLLTGRCRLTVMINKNTQNRQHGGSVPTEQRFTWGQRFGGCVSSDPTGSPFSHRSPIHPAAQLQRPVCVSHWPPFSHSHRCWQSAPNLPATHSTHKYTPDIKQIKDKGVTIWTTYDEETSSVTFLLRSAMCTFFNKTLYFNQKNRLRIRELGRQIHSCKKIRGFFFCFSFSMRQGEGLVQLYGERL